MSEAGPQFRSLAPGVHVAEAKQRYLGLEVGTRMTVLELDGGLLVHSPFDADPSCVAGFGDARWALAPNLLHHLYVGRWAEAGLEPWGCPGLPEKRDDVDFQGVVERGERPFGAAVETHTLRCIDMTNEVVLFHAPTRTLVCTDLVFNFSKRAPWFTRFAMRCMCGYPGCKTTLLERAKMRRDLAREDLRAILAWDFDRVIMAHGEVIEAGGHQAVRQAFGWLLD